MHIGIIDFFLVQPAYYALVGHDARLVQGGLPVEQHGVAVDQVAVDELGSAAAALARSECVGGGCEKGLGEGLALGGVVRVDELAVARLVLHVNGTYIN